MLEEQEIEKCQKVLAELHRLQSIYNQNNQVEDPYAQLTLARTYYMASIHFRDANLQEQSSCGLPQRKTSRWQPTSAGRC